MKTLRIFIVTALIVCLTSAAPVFAKSKTTYKNLKGLKSKTLSMTTVKVSWKKHRVDKYVIYKVTQGNDGKEKYKKLKTVSGKKKSAVLKLGKNKEIYILVKGVKKKKHGKKIVYENTTYACSGLLRPEWYEKLSYCYRSPTEIDLNFGVEEIGGLRPTGFWIYKKEAGAKKYKLVKAIKIKRKAGDWFRWKDRSVKPGAYYSYKVCSYLKSGKKVYRSKMSETKLIGAVNYEGQFHVQMESDENTITLQVTSDLLNGETYGYLDSNEGFPSEEVDVCYILNSYSDDGKTWSSSDNKWGSCPFSLKPGESFWIRLEKKQDANLYDQYVKRKRPVGGLYMTCGYRGIDDAFMWINAYSDHATCHI